MGSKLGGNPKVTEPGSDPGHARADEGLKPASTWLEYSAPFLNLLMKFNFLVHRIVTNWQRNPYVTFLYFELPRQKRFHP